MQVLFEPQLHALKSPWKWRTSPRRVCNPIGAYREEPPLRMARPDLKPCRPWLIFSRIIFLTNLCGIVTLLQTPRTTLQCAISITTPTPSGWKLREVAQNLGDEGFHG